MYHLVGILCVEVVLDGNDAGFPKVVGGDLDEVGQF